jgi:hypothetical protein
MIKEFYAKRDGDSGREMERGMPSADADHNKASNS